MKKQINIRKVASISLAFLMASLYSTNAMEDGMGGTSGTPKAIIGSTEWVRAEVERVLEQFQNNMNEYYARTGNLKRIAIITTPDRKISENLVLTSGGTIDIKRMIGKSPEKIAEHARNFLEMHSSGNSAYSESDRAILMKIEKEREERLQEIIAEQSLSREEAEEKLNAEISKETEKYWAAARKESADPQKMLANITTTSTITTTGNPSGSGVGHHSTASVNAHQPKLLNGKYNIVACGLKDNAGELIAGQLIFTQNQPDVIQIGGFKLNIPLPEIPYDDISPYDFLKTNNLFANFIEEENIPENFKADNFKGKANNEFIKFIDEQLGDPHIFIKKINNPENIFIQAIKKEYGEQDYKKSIPYGNYQTCRFINSISGDTKFSLNICPNTLDRISLYRQELQWESGDEINSMVIQLLIYPENQSPELFIIRPHPDNIHGSWGTAQKFFIPKERTGMFKQEEKVKL